jgi:hypothetical protein
MNKILKKIKHLRVTMLDYGIAKFKKHADNPVDWPKWFLEDFNYVDELENELVQNKNYVYEVFELNRKDLKKCNHLYKQYNAR